MTFISYAQNLEDVLLWRALGGIERGFYVDVGAYHPDSDSVTRAFYDRGWSGLNIEPLAEAARRLIAARPRDVTLQVAIGAEAGEMPFYRIDGSGLSTLDPEIAAQHEAAGLRVTPGRVRVSTLAEICTLHAQPEIHFLKIDVEGAERAVLEGADLVRFRPWIVLVEATAPTTSRPTHAGWEPLLLEAEYDFVWFDGLNRYYVAHERHDRLAPAFSSQPNVFDDFMRDRDSALIGRAAALETEVAMLRERIGLAEAQAQAASGSERRWRETALHDSERLLESLGRLRNQATQTEQELARDLAAEQAALHLSRHELQHTHLRLQRALQEVEALHESSSWKLTRPVRVAIRQARRFAGGGAPPASPQAVAPSSGPVPATLAPLADDHAADEATDEPGEQDEELFLASLPPLPITPPPPLTATALQSGGLTAVHQFHSGSAVHDAITNAMLLTRGLLRGMGYHSEIYTEQPPEALADELLPMEALPRHDGYVLIVRHSMGYDRFEQILALPAPKLLLYHNITPPELLLRHPHLAHYAKLGRRQLATFRGRVAAALADSEYNANELRGLGLAPVRACTLLFDPERLRRSAADAKAKLRDGAVFTVLFVGRINSSKGQLELVEAFAAFRSRLSRPARLVLVGEEDAADGRYVAMVRQAIERHGLQADIVLAGGVSDTMLHEWYAAADLYVSLSWHEGFGVPLVEAVAHGVPVLAWPGGAVPYTLGTASGLLEDRAPAVVAGRMFSLAEDADARAAVTLAQAACLDRFTLDRQCGVLAQALLRAGAAPPADSTTATLLEANLRFSITGHVNGSYSLAAINRDLARALESVRPGAVRVLPVEGAPTMDLSGVPADEMPELTALAHRPPHATGPGLVISQHYPVHVPPRRGDVTVAMLFWEETLLPSSTIELLGRHFDAVVAPTCFVRDALLQSGLRVPVRVIPPAVRLERFAALRAAPRTPSPVHRFLHVSSCFPRKGVDALLRAWAVAFRAGDPVRLVIKGFPNPHNDVAQQLEALRAAEPGLAPVELIDADLEGDALLALYRDADTMVLPTRGEGYNLPAAEALAAGLGLIVTGRGGHMDFCTGPDGPLPGVRLVHYRAAPSRTHLATPHSLWLEPAHDDLVAALRERIATIRPAAEGLRLPDANHLAAAWSGLARDLLLAAPATIPRVTWVSSWGIRCGVAEYSRQMLDGMLDRPGEGAGLHVRVLCDRRTVIDHDAPADDDRKIEVWPCWNSGDRRTVEPLALAIAADDAQAVVLQHQPGLLSFENLGRLLDHRAMRGRIVLVTLHNTSHLLDLADQALQSAVVALRRADRVLVHTVADLERLQSLGLVDNIVLLPHGVAHSPPPPAPRQIGEDDRPIIGCYGFFLPGKGIDILIGAFAMLRRRWPGARLLLVNAEYDHPDSLGEIHRCQALAADLGIDGAVTFETGFLTHRRSLELLSTCDVVALPYRPSKEASSAAMRTALTSGVAVAVTPVDLFEEAGEAVYRFDDTTADAVARGIASLLADRDLRMAQQYRSRDWIAARQWPDIGRRLSGMIAGLIRTRTLDQGS
ncbi:FkbM family methyltransferase [Lichenicoccus roseus]|uniref:FkbM family methyltransferase n=1 Tax=Lichenicoccus roseus TaxID=2683649 RepID=A0A5R9J7V8_9PROT|nr:FkbM family methyltransferase [Lichenicoccus roseus]TLU73700.1 FkbM family methyltransferase [Lichenicoccus roseus]